MTAAQIRGRIAHVVLDLHEGGLERLVVDLAMGMRARGYESRVFCLRRRGQLADELDAHELEVVPQAGGLVEMLRPRAIALALKAFSADVVHGHSGTFFKAVRAARMAGLPVLLTDHGRPYPDPIAARFFDGLAARAASRVVAVSTPLKFYLSERLLVPSGRIETIRNGVRPTPEPTAHIITETRRTLQADRRHLVGSVGRLDPVKAYDVLIRALRILLDRSQGDRTPHLVLVGDGPDRHRLEEIIESLGMRPHVTLTGWVADVGPLLCALDVFVLSSDSEGTSVSLLEAMRARKAIVATAVGGTPEVLGEQLASQLVPPQDPSAMAAALERILQSPSTRAAVESLARERVETAYSQEGMLKEYDAAYSRLIAAP